MSGYVKTSFLDGFEIPEITHQAIKESLIKVGRSATVSRTSTFNDLPLSEKIKRATQAVRDALGRYKGFVKSIRSEEEFKRYVDKVIKCGVLSFDTETNNSLDPLTCKTMGLCMYIPNTKPVYVPLNHCEPGTDVLLKNQVREKFAREQLQRISDSGVKIIYHNAKFDIRVCRDSLGVSLPVWWDTMIASQLLDENELARLKYQYNKHIDSTVGTYDIESLFCGLPYAWFDPDEVFALYAAIDAYDTYLLYEYQRNIFEKEGMEKLYNLFLNVEIPVVGITAQMEDNGICIDSDFLSALDHKYKTRRDEALKSLYSYIEPYSAQVEKYQESGALGNPVNFDSPQQLNIILYDILKTPVKQGMKKATDKTTLKLLGTDFTNKLLVYRHYNKLITSFTETLPNALSERDGKLHANFHQMGAEDNNVRTGRFSSSSPKMCWAFVA